MNITTVRKELHQLIDQADDRLIKLIYGMMKADQQEGSQMPDFHEPNADDTLSRQEAQQLLRKHKLQKPTNQQKAKDEYFREKYNL